VWDEKVKLEVLLRVNQELTRFGKLCEKQKQLGSVKASGLTDRVRQEQNIKMVAFDQKRNGRSFIDLAKRKIEIEKGIFAGICTECGDLIPKDRILACLTTDYCIECAKRFSSSSKRVKMI